MAAIGIFVQFPSELYPADERGHQRIGQADTFSGSRFNFLQRRQHSRCIQNRCLVPIVEKRQVRAGEHRSRHPVLPEESELRRLQRVHRRIWR